MDEFSQETSPFNKLTGKQRAFVESYVKCWNATQAAKAAGYQCNSDASFAVVGHNTLKNVKVKRAIHILTKANAMDAIEALSRLARMARGSLGHFMTQDPTTGEWKLDLTKAGNRGSLDLIKSLTFSGENIQRIELYDAKDALKLVGQALELFDGGVTVNLPPFDAAAWKAQADKRLNEVEALPDIYKADDDEPEGDLEPGA